MNIASPLRYPGGKASLSDILIQIRDINNLNNRTMVEPFAGGAGASLSLLFHEFTSSIHINDRDSSIFDFWWAIKNRCDKFIEMIKDAKISIEEWQNQRDIYRSTRKLSRLVRGYATFYLNRCNRSGVIFNGGPIGGIEQKGKWKLDARFNREELIKRCERVNSYSDRIVVSNDDGIELLKTTAQDEQFFFIDPPYFHKGQSLYLNVADSDYHRRLARQLKSMKRMAWVLTYDDCPEIRSLYNGWTNLRPFSLRYSAAERRGGSEILVTPKWMNLPKSQASKSIAW
jgi:DNA adenine methylase